MKKHSLIRAISITALIALSNSVLSNPTKIDIPANEPLTKGIFKRVNSPHQFPRLIEFLHGTQRNGTPNKWQLKSQDNKLVPDDKDNKLQYDFLTTLAQSYQDTASTVPSQRLLTFATRVTYRLNEAKNFAIAEEISAPHDSWYVQEKCLETRTTFDQENPVNKVVCKVPYDIFDHGFLPPKREVTINDKSVTIISDTNYQYLGGGKDQRKVVYTYPDEEITEENRWYTEKETFDTHVTLTQTRTKDADLEKYGPNVLLTEQQQKARIRNHGTTKRTYTWLSVGAATTTALTVTAAAWQCYNWFKK